MDYTELFEGFSGIRVHMIGIKGTGMAALAEILVKKQAIITGSDTGEQFYTDAILKDLNIPVYQAFSPGHIHTDVKIVIYSSAYSKESNPELASAFSRNIPCLSYPEALGMLSRYQDSSGISGVHGKTTTTAITGTLLKELKLPATILAGSQVPTFGNRSTITLGNSYFVAETCEYKKHFLKFRADRIIMTAIELDHPDFFRSLDDVYDTFEEYGCSISQNGTLIYNADDNGAVIVVKRVARKRQDLEFVPYGTQAEGRFCITSIRSAAGKLSFALDGFPGSFDISVPGIHNVYNAAASIALVTSIIEKEKRSVQDDDIRAMKKGLWEFRGSKRRSEILGETGSVLFMDDYAHHPTAIRTTLKGYREFYPERRIVVDFMSHTYSRTKELLSEFGTAFSSADEVILHNIYASARETRTGSFDGTNLYREVAMHHAQVKYFARMEEALPYIKSVLQPGVLFVTMGAGDNWKIGRQLYDSLKDSN